MQPLAGKAALVTGASRGIGLATAIALGEAGASVAFNYRNSKGDAEAGAEQVRRAGGKAILVPGDVADQQAVKAMVDQTVAAFGHLDIAVSNAAYSDRQPFYEADLDGFRRTIDVTMWGAFNLMHAATLQMLGQPWTNQNEARGAIVIVSSPHAYVAVPRSMAYNMSKAAIDHMARTAAIELAEHRIRINIMTPGWIDTPGERKFATEEQIQNAGKKLPWGRLGKPEEIARGVVFMCDPRNDYMTGGAMLIDGAITLPWWASRGSGVPE